MADIYLHMIVPQAINDSVFSSSTAPETDYTAWATATGYIIGDTRIYVAANVHWVIQCVQAHTSSTGSTNDPIKDINATTGGGAFWVRYSFTNKWKIADGRITDQKAFNGTITDVFVAAANASSLAVFNVTANTVTLTITQTSTATVRSAQTVSAIETVGITDWWSYFFNAVEYKSEIIFSGVPIYAGDTIQVDVAGLTTNKIGELVWGIDYSLGLATFPKGIGTIDYSTKDRDTFGNVYITKRPFASTADYKTIFDTSIANRTKRLVAASQSAPVIFYTRTTDSNYGDMVYGIIKSFAIDEVAPNISYLSLQVEGLI